MSEKTFVVPKIAFEKLRQAARKIKKNFAVPHHQALDTVASRAGFHHWHEAVNATKLTSIAESAIQSGLVIAMDVSEAQDFFDSENRFIEDQRLCYLLENQFIELCKEFENEDGVRYNQALSQDQLVEETREFMMNFIFYRYVRSEIPASLDNALETVSDCCFWQPVYTWFKGDFFELR